MNLFGFLGEIFKPAVQLVDELHTSTEEKGQIKIRLSELKNEMAKIEANVATKMLELQSKSLEANAQIAISEQQAGNFLSKSWRPLCSMGCFAIIFGMSYGVLKYDELIIQVCGAFLGIYGFGRSMEKKK